jgi:hypothetical protein
LIAEDDIDALEYQYLGLTEGIHHKIYKLNILQTKNMGSTVFEIEIYPLKHEIRIFPL